MRSIWKFFTSLRLTVACLAIGLVLVFFGTLAQVDEGLWNAQTRWFRSFFIWWGPQGSALHIPIFPGGYLLGCVLMLNLLAAHYKRFTWSVRKIGIQLTHLGVVVLLAGQLITDRFATESMLSLHVGQTKNYSEAARQNELVFATDSAIAGQEDVVSIPQQMLAEKKEITPPQLPFSLRVKSYHPNGLVIARSSVMEAAKQPVTAVATLEAEFSMPEGLVPQAERAAGTPGRQEVWAHALEAVGEHDTKDIVAAARRVAADRPRAEQLCRELIKRFRQGMLSRFKMMDGPNLLGRQFVAEKLSREEKVTDDSMPNAAENGFGKEAVSLVLPETKDMDTQNLPFAVVELINKGATLGNWVVTPIFEAQEITVDGKTYRMALRGTRIYHNFSTTLLSTKHDQYQGTDIPKNFQSRVRIKNPASGETREVDIYMNNPLRYAGLTFYQYQMGREEAAAHRDTSTLQVVANPGAVTPYLGCIMVGLGMLYQFLFHLVGFIAKRREAPQTEPESNKSRKRGGAVRSRETASTR
jgi:hypothetical protein